MAVPYVIEDDGKGGERVYDLGSRLLKDRIISLEGVFTQELAGSIVKQLLFLEADSPEKDIQMYINSPGGEISAMYAIYDTMTYVKSDVVTIALGTAMSAGSFILAAGAKGKRYALPNTDIMIHELAGGTQGKYQEMLNRMKHTEKLYAKMAKDYVKFTGQKLVKIKKDMERDFFMDAEEAKKYGLIDHVEYQRK
ncbi:ATP-dependent Clp protease proteolytic subunit [Candidatus Fermentibacteria bacterium]|nr:MAG: ATP-dependent Clp protease proteolytic subunit [Candidatus Fermentibacteria bacterium]